METVAITKQFAEAEIKGINKELLDHLNTDESKSFKGFLMMLSPKEIEFLANITEKQEQNIDFGIMVLIILCQGLPVEGRKFTKEEFDKVTRDVSRDITLVSLKNKGMVDLKPSTKGDDDWGVRMTEKGKNELKRDVYEGI